MDFMAIEFEPGRFVFQGTPRMDHYNPLGIVHGGYAATLLDSCVGCAVHTMLPAGTGYTTLELKVNYIRAMTDRTGPVRAEGKLDLGRQPDRRRRGPADRQHRQAARVRDDDLPRVPDLSARRRVARREAAFHARSGGRLVLLDEPAPHA